jgi:glycosyltransferase involved in cell wall biosynthesis
MQEETGVRKVRLAYVVSHPIQYQADLLRTIAADPGIDLCVFFCSDFSAGSYQDQGFGVNVAWDVPLLSGYRYVVLPRWFETHSPSVFRPISRGIYRHLHRGLDGYPFDAVWVHGYSTVNALHAMLAAKALGLPVITRVESWLGDRTRSGARLLLKQAFFNLLRSLTDAVLAVGTHNAEYWKHYMGAQFPIFPMPYAVNNGYFSDRTATATASRAELQRELGLDPDRPVLLFASKLQERKHCDHLLEAYLLLRQEGSLAPQLVIVGDGEMRPQLEARARESSVDGILFAGFRNQSELPRFFDLSTVFILPSGHEPWGLIVNEAMASGLPVIVTNEVGSAIDLVRQGENGYVYPMGDIPALKNALAAVLVPGAAKVMGQRSRERMSTWSFREDVEGLRAALVSVTRRRLVSQIPVAQAR